ncbi:MAG: M23 family metallopeptidase [bacterium]|nr:M23 family metallopeptidase [bacterium]
MLKTVGKIGCVIIVLGTWLFLFFGDNSAFISHPDIVVRKEILQGSTFSVIASDAGVATDTVNTLLESTKDIYDLARITAGKTIDFLFENNASTTFKGLVYEINNEEELLIENISTSTVETWQASRVQIEYTTETAVVTGVIESSLYQTIVDQGADERLAMALAEMFAWQVDFAAQVQKGDSFKAVYEKKFRDGVYDHPGNVLAGEFYNNGEKFLGFYFPGSENSTAPISSEQDDSGRVSTTRFEGTRPGHYDENGNSLQKEFLKAPLQYKYISSGFTYKRFNPILKQFTAHRGIDYAAPHGTPAVTIGDGTVVQAGWNGYYGISVKVRHNEMYSTVYGHFSSLAKGIRVGAHVVQGQIVGYVGSTGLSTGPHLHYEMHRFGTLVNPFTEKIPPGEPVAESDRTAFDAMKAPLEEKLLSI